MTLNEKTVTIKLQRRDICNLILACRAILLASDAEKWERLYNKLSMALGEFDSKTKEGLK